MPYDECRSASPDQSLHQRSISLPRDRKPGSFLWSSSSTTLNSSQLELPLPASSSFSSSVSSGNVIAEKWKASRFNLAVEYLKHEKVSWSAFGAAIVNFTNSILGAGLMGIPYAMSRAGLVPGIVLLMLIAVISDWSVLIMVKSGRSVNATSYQDMMRKAFGPVGAGFSAFFQFLFAFGCMCAYLLIIADNLTRVIGYYLPQSLLASRTLLLLVGNFLIALPLSLAKDVTFIGKVASLSIGGNMLIALAVLLQRGAVESMRLPEYKLFSSNIVEAIGVISFSFVCHHNTFLIRESLETKSSRVFSVVTTLSVGFSLLLSLLLSVPAYMHFGGSTTANILNNFDEGNALINVCRVVFAGSLYLSYPLDCFVARDVMSISLFPKSSAKMPELMHNTITLMIFCSTTAVALMYTDLGECLELTGSISASALAFIFPAAAFLKIYSFKEKYAVSKVFAILLIAFGSLVMLIAASKQSFKLIAT